MIPILVLRPEPGAAATVRRAGAMGLRAVSAPLFTIEPVAWDAPAPAAHDALMITSANAVRQAGPALALYRALPAYAVGATTAAALRAAGFAAVTAGDADARALAALLRADRRARPLHLAGEDVRDAAPPGATRVTVYRARALAALPTPALAALGQGAVAALHSPRAAALFAALIERAGLDRTAIAIAAISAAAAAAAGEGWRARALAAAPRDDALLAAAAPLCEDDAGSRIARG